MQIPKMATPVPIIHLTTPLDSISVWIGSWGSGNSVSPVISHSIESLTDPNSASLNESLKHRTQYLTGHDRPNQQGSWY